MSSACVAAELSVAPTSSRFLIPITVNTPRTAPDTPDPGREVEVIPYSDIYTLISFLKTSVVITPLTFIWLAITLHEYVSQSIQWLKTASDTNEKCLPRALWPESRSFRNTVFFYKTRRQAKSTNPGSVPLSELFRIHTRFHIKPNTLGRGEHTRAEGSSIPLKRAFFARNKNRVPSLSRNINCLIGPVIYAGKKKKGSESVRQGTKSLLLYLGN